MLVYIDNNLDRILWMIELIGYHRIENIFVYDELYKELRASIPFQVTPEQYKYLSYLHTRYIDWFEKKRNQLASYLKFHSYRETVMPSNALTEKHIKRLYHLVQENTIEEVVFYWSQVISVVGGSLECIINTSLFKMDDIAEYLFGSKKRIEMLREMFSYLHSKNVKIYIIYHTLLSLSSREKLLKIIHYLYPFFNEDHIYFLNFCNK
jgi:hypothetical protein